MCVSSAPARVVPVGKLSQRRWKSRFIGIGARQTSGGVWPPCEWAGRKEMNIVKAPKYPMRRPALLGLGEERESVTFIVSMEKHGND